MVISDCISITSSTDESVIRVRSVNSVAITYSFFSKSSVRSILSTKNTDEVVIADCFIDRNIATFSAISCDSSRTFQSISIFIISNTNVINNTNLLYMLHMEGFESSKVLNCTFLKNIGGISLKDSDEIVVNQTKFEGNRGTAINLWSYRDIMIVDTCNFTFNTAKHSAAAINSYANKPIIIQRSVFNNNQAKKDGGAIQTHSNETRVIDSQFFNNTALKGDGGAMWISGNLYVTSSSFSSNIATSGGALSVNLDFMDFQHVAIQDSHFSWNIATGKGGGAVVIKSK